MPVTVLSGAQDGLSVNDICQILADEWGGSVSNNRWLNVQKRRINRVLRDLAIRFPRNRIFRVSGGEITLQAGVSDYNVRETTENGGWGWLTCTDVENIYFNSVDMRPLERVPTLEQIRERALLLAQTGSPVSWVPLDRTRIRIIPTPDVEYTGNGDYWAEMPSLNSGKLEWPRAWDEVLVAGVELIYARQRYRAAPRSITPYEQRYEYQIQRIEETEIAKPGRPNRAAVTRTMRTRRVVPHDNSSDVRYWR